MVISDRDGAGKSTTDSALRAADPRLKHSVSITTSAPRPGETDGVHYHFRTMDQFKTMAEQGELLEWATVFGRGYGTPRAPVEDALAAGYDMVFDIDWQGHRQIRTALPADVVSLFVLPPSLPELERRLTGRASDAAEEIRRRMDAALAEISHWQEFDHVIVNNELDRAIVETRSILTAARLRTTRQTGLNDFVASFLG